MQKYHDVIQDLEGNVINTATVTVYEANTAVLATLYQDDEIATYSNPFTVTDANYSSNGAFFFKADNGEYDIKIVNGAETEWKYDVTLLDFDQNSIYVAANKAAAVLITPQAGKVLHVLSDDGGDFKYLSGSGLTDNGGSYCGTQFIPTGGDGTSAWVRVYDGAVYVEWFGATTTNLDTILPVVNAYCITTGETMRCAIIGNLSDTVRVKVGRHSFDFTGSEFTSNKSDAGYAWEFAVDDSGTTPDFNPVFDVKGFNLRPGTVGATTDGVSWGRQSDQVQGESGRIAIINPVVAKTTTRFRHNWTWLDDTFINKVDNVYLTGGTLSNVRVLTQSNAGENISYHGGVISNVHDSSADDGAQFLMETDSNADIYCFGTSLDYGDRIAKINAGQLNLIGCHSENNSSKTDIILTETNNQPITLNIVGGTLATGPLGGGAGNPPIEQADGKASRIKSTGSKININLSGFGNSLRDKIDTELVTVVSGTPVLKIDAPFFDTTVTKPAILSRYLNRCVNGDFSGNNTTSWTLNGTTGASIATSAVEAFNDTYSLEFDGTVGGSFSALQKFNVNGQTRFLFRSQAKMTAFTSGEMKMQIRFFDWLGNLIGARSSNGLTAASSDWELLADTSSMPANTYQIELQLTASSLIGTCYIDDIVCNIF